MLRGARRRDRGGARCTSTTTGSCGSRSGSSRRSALRLDRSSPMVDARLPDGSRLHAVIPPLAIDGPCLTIRRFGARRMGLDAFGVAGDAGALLLRSLVADGANIVVSGGTGSGKTTLLNALAGHLGADRADHHHRGDGGAAARRSRTSSGSRRARPTPRAPARSRCGTSSAPRCGCDPTGSSSARCAAPRRSTCSRRSTPVTTARSPPCTPTARSTRCAGCRRSRCSAGPDFRTTRCASSCARRSTSSSRSRAARGGAREVVAVVEVVDAAGPFAVRPLLVRTRDRARGRGSARARRPAGVGPMTGSARRWCSSASRWSRCSSATRAVPAPAARARVLRPGGRRCCRRGSAAVLADRLARADLDVTPEAALRLVGARRGRRRVVRARCSSARWSCPPSWARVGRGPGRARGARRPCRSSGACRAARCARPRRRPRAAPAAPSPSRCTLLAGRAGSAGVRPAPHVGPPPSRRAARRRARRAGPTSDPWPGVRAGRRRARRWSPPSGARPPARSRDSPRRCGPTSRRRARPARCRRRRGCRRWWSGSRRSRTSRSPRWRIRRRRGRSSPRTRVGSASCVGLALEALAAVWMRALVRAT